MPISFPAVDIFTLRDRTRYSLRCWTNSVEKERKEIDGSKKIELAKLILLGIRVNWMHPGRPKFILRILNGENMHWKMDTLANAKPQFQCKYSIFLSDILNATVACGFTSDTPSDQRSANKPCSLHQIRINADANILIVCSKRTCKKEWTQHSLCALPYLFFAFHSYCVLRVINDWVCSAMMLFWRANISSRKNEDLLIATDRFGACVHSTVGK